MHFNLHVVFWFNSSSSFSSSIFIWQIDVHLCPSVPPNVFYGRAPRNIAALCG